MCRQYGAVRSPLGRLIPNAAQSNSERICIGSCRCEYSRVDRRRFSAANNGMPPSRRGDGKTTGSAPCDVTAPEAAESAALARIAVLTCRRVVIFLSRHSCLCSRFRICSRRRLAMSYRFPHMALRYPFSANCCVHKSMSQGCSSDHALRQETPKMAIGSRHVHYGPYAPLVRTKQIGGPFRRCCFVRRYAGSSATIGSNTAHP